MPSSIWSGAVSFGLVNVPVKLISATKSQDVRFHQLEEGSGARIRLRKVSEQSGEEVPNDRIVKGYELSAGQHVVVEPGEIEALAPKASKAIEIEDFVDLDQIDPVFFEQPYYLVPDKTAAKPYRLLVDAMTELNKVAIGRFVLRSKEHLVAIRPVHGVLTLEMMRFADEVLAPEGAEPAQDDDAAPNERELTMARQLIEALSSEFEPGKYHDTFREQLVALIKAKAEGQAIVAEPEVEEPAKVVDLMAALEASLERAGAGGGEAASEEKPKRRTRKSA
ncbi:MAG: Ku protein [Acidimicrobiia bacterium]